MLVISICAIIFVVALLYSIFEELRGNKVYMYGSLVIALLALAIGGPEVIELIFTSTRLDESIA